MVFLPKNAEIKKIEGILVINGMFSETTYGRVLMYQISRFYHNSNEF